MCKRATCEVRPGRQSKTVVNKRGGRPMHITCRRRDLYRALWLLSHAIPTRSTLPILQHVLVEASGAGRLRLAATNLEMGIACLIGVAVEEEGSAAVPALPLLA